MNIIKDQFSTIDLASANRSRAASAASGLQPIVASLRACVIAKNSALLPLHSRYGHASLRAVFPYGDFQG